MDAHLKSAEEWLKTPEFAGITVLDPDGWDRKNFEASWAEKITRQEFNRRILISTCLFRSTADAASCLEAMLPGDDSISDERRADILDAIAANEG